jgi:hypothetical protein
MQAQQKEVFFLLYEETRFAHGKPRWTGWQLPHYRKEFTRRQGIRKVI